MVSCSVCNYLSFPNHDIIITSKDDYYHTAECQNCDYSVENMHHKELNEDGAGAHIYSCSECNYYKREAHNIDYEIVDNSNHTRYCTICDYSETYNHNFSYQSMGVDKHILTCTCGATQGNASAHVWTATDLTNTVECKHCKCIKKLGMGEFVPIIKTKIEIEEETE